jgi:hypothetical protein
MEFDSGAALPSYDVSAFKGKHDPIFKYNKDAFLYNKENKKYLNPKPSTQNKLKKVNPIP